jgi:monofunctional glycosyltransferase
LLLLPVALLLPLRWVDPWFTGVQAQRRVESWFAAGRYQKRYTPVALGKISPHLRHAVVAAEDGRFFQHWGIDWAELWKVTEKGVDSRKSLRGASTITQQLVKNLFFTTHRNPVRKVAEFGLAPAAELVLGKDRILELYLNSVEWGPGVFGAEAAARYHYGVGAGALSREQAARMAACLPAPRRRRPAAMHQYGAIILDRMGQMGW